MSRFEVDTQLLAEFRVALAGRDDLFWVLGGAGSGKTTICRALSARSGLGYLDLDAPSTARSTAGSRKRVTR